MPCSPVSTSLGNHNFVKVMGCLYLYKWKRLLDKDSSSENKLPAKLVTESSCSYCCSNKTETIIIASTWRLELVVLASPKDQISYQYGISHCYLDKLTYCSSGKLQSNLDILINLEKGRWKGSNCFLKPQSDVEWINV